MPSSRNNLGSLVRWASFLALLAGGVCDGGMACAAAKEQESNSERRSRIAHMSPEEKESLRAKFETFNRLEPAEQERLRKVHADIVADPAAPRLQGVLDRYHEWQKTITSAQRAELLQMPAEERIQRIGELLQEQAKQRVRELAGRPLPEQDIEAIYSWLGRFLKRFETEFKERMPSDVRERLEKTADETAWRQQILRYLVYRGGRGEFPFPRPTQEEFQEILTKLSPESRQVLESAKTPEDRESIARQWVFMTMRTKAFPTVPEEELRKLYQELPTSERERLEGLEPTELKRLLTMRYFYRGFARPPGGPSFGPGFGPGGPSFGPFRDGGRGPGAPSSASSGGPVAPPSGEGSPREGPFDRRPKGGNGPSGGSRFGEGSPKSRPRPPSPPPENSAGAD
jgi:hypothetical protein